MIPLLIRPKVLALKNRWLKTASRDVYIRDTILVGAALGLMYSIYFGGMRALYKIEQHISFAYLDPGTIMGMVLVFLISMLFISNSVSALGVLFQSQDLDLVMASPLVRLRFYLNKFTEIALSTSSIAVIVIMPVIMVFLNYYHVSWRFIPFSAVVLLPFFVFPVVAGMLFATSLAILVPPDKTKYLVTSLVLIVLTLFLMFCFGVGSEANSGGNQNAKVLYTVVQIFSLPNQKWMPSYWASVAIGEYIAPSGRPLWLFVSVSYAAAVSALMFGFIVHCFSHDEAYSRGFNRDSGVGSIATVSRFGRAFQPALRLIPQGLRAMLLKEVRSIARDASQAVQLFMLLSISFMYVYFLSVENILEGKVAVQLLSWWKIFLIMTDVTLQAFLVLAIGTRLVFPSVSLEGKGVWVLQSAPMTYQDWLRMKHRLWLIILMPVLLIFFGLTSIVYEGSLYYLLLKLFVSAVLVYGIVGLATGLGAYFANFTWEHPAQLAASIGSMAFMIIGVLIVVVDGILVWMFLKSAELMHYSSAVSSNMGLKEFCVGSMLGTAIAVVVFNRWLVREVISLGEDTLVAMDEV